PAVVCEGDPRGIALATARIAAGATALRNMIVEAWLDSASTPIGYPMVNVWDIESGKVRATRDLLGWIRKSSKEVGWIAELFATLVIYEAMIPQASTRLVVALPC